MSFDPRALGAQCDRCYLRACREGVAVPSELNRYARFAVVGEAPGKEEVEQLRPFVGASGRELTTSLHSVGVARDTAAFVNAIACRPPGNDLDTLLHRCQQENKRRALEAKPAWLTPIEACRPRLYADLARFDKLVTVGKQALRGVTGQMTSIMDLRGAPLTGILATDAHGGFHWIARETLDPDPKDPALQAGRFMRVLPTIHPAFVLHQRRWTKVFRADLGRAVRWFDGKLGWQAPKANYLPTPREVRSFLYGGAPFYTYDVETDAKEPLTARLRCIGISTTSEGIVIPFLSIDGQTRFYSDDDLEEIKDILRGWFVDERILKTGWNLGYYDRIVVQQHLGVTPRPIVDGMLIHRSVDSELPHGLAFVGSLTTDVARAWKASHAATNSQTDAELHEYNLLDCVVNARTMEPLHQAVQLRGQAHVVPIDHKQQSVCVGYHVNGMYVDQAVRVQLDEKYRKEAQENLHALRMTVGDLAFNPNSVPQVRDLLFEEWGFPPIETTMRGDPSTNDDTLRKLLLRPTLSQPQRDFLCAMRKYRRAVKFRGTFIRPLRPWNEPVYEDDDFAVDVSTPEGAAMFDEMAEAVISATEEVLGKKAGRAVRELVGKKPGLVLADGRVHSSWNCHVATTGRKSSSEPNVQNIVRALRGMFTAEQGRMLVAADMDQLELRISAAYAGADRYLTAFKSGADPHAITSEAIYGAQFRNGSEKDKKRIRDFAKRFVYAVIYGATVETIHDTIASAENDAGELIFPWVTLRETDTLLRRWMRENPEFARWWESTLSDYRRQGYLEEPVHGRRRFFLDGEDRNEIINYRVQSAGASHVTEAEIKLVEGPLPFEKWGPGTGLIHNGHDALTAEAPCKHCNGKPFKWPKGVMPPGNIAGHPPLGKGEHCPVVDAGLAIQEAMTGKLKGYDVMLTATPKIGFTWAEV